MLEELLPAAVVCVEARIDPADVVLYPEELAVVARAVDKRRREFATVRACARTALDRLGVAPAPLIPGPRGAPRWPVGVVGSMTHCDGFRAAAVARAAEVTTLGVDAEPHRPLPAGVLKLVSDGEERAGLAALAALKPAVCWDRLLFSAKESVYKAWFPLTGRWLDFTEARVGVQPEAGTFTARLLVSGPTVGGRELTGFAGRWLARDGLVLTAIAVSAAPAGTAADRPVAM